MRRSRRRHSWRWASTATRRAAIACWRSSRCELANARSSRRSALRLGSPRLPILKRLVRGGSERFSPRLPSQLSRALGHEGLVKEEGVSDLAQALSGLGQGNRLRLAACPGRPARCLSDLSDLDRCAVDTVEDATGALLGHLEVESGEILAMDERPAVVPALDVLGGAFLDCRLEEG